LGILVLPGKMDKEKPVFIQDMRMNHSVFTYDDIFPVHLGETQFLSGKKEYYG
jgi:hypothetical protein